MQIVKSYIETKQRQFAGHPFFAWLEKSGNEAEVARLLPSLTFWVASFQDVLALNEAHVCDPELRKIARHHRKEDSGHDRWFFDDLQLLEVTMPTTRDLFGKPHAAIRHASYALMAEVFRASSDVCRIALLLTLESTGHIFFEEMARWQERFDNARGLKYFSRHHIEIEKNHELFEKELTAHLDALELDLPVRAEAIAIVDRCYIAFQTMFDTLVSASQRTKPQPLPAEGSSASA